MIFNSYSLKCKVFNRVKAKICPVNHKSQSFEVKWKDEDLLLTPLYTCNHLLYHRL